ncbi:MAG: GerMN domain-containing protein [Thermoanaerobaculia bacterium]
MTKTTAWAAIAVSAAAVALLFLLARREGSARSKGRPGEVVRPKESGPLKLGPGSPTPPAAENVRVTLFFPSKEDGLLRPEERDVEKPADAVGFARELMREEIAGPKDPRLAPALPEKFSLRNGFVPGNGQVVVDFDVDPSWARSAGSSEELAAVGAIVDTLLQNLAQTDRVRILVNGNPVETLAGHVDVSRPLPAMRDVVGEIAAPAR